MAKVRLFNDDCVNILKKLPENSIHAVVTDPPYCIESIMKRFGGNNKRAQGGKDGAFSRMSDKFLGKEWDTDIALTVDFWKEVYRVLKPGGMLVSFAFVKKYHRMACAVEDAGFQVKSMIGWIYGTGNPMGRNLGKDLDKKGIKDKEAYNFHNTIKPAIEPILIAFKPFKGSLADNYLKYGVAGLYNVGGCKVRGKFPSNVMRQKSKAVEKEFIRQLDDDAKRVAQFFYCPKPTKREKGDSSHPTVKPERLMRYLVRLVTKEGQTVLDPFAGSGTTIVAALKENRNVLGIEQDPKYFKEMEDRVSNR